MNNNSVSRRALLKTGAGLVASTTPGVEANAAAGPQAPLPLVVDSSVTCELAAPMLAKRGVKVVMRYYLHDFQPTFKTKILSQSEARAIHASKMAIGLTYQNNNRVIERFSKAYAIEAANYCMSRDAGLNPGKPNVIHHPKGTAIYFGVDNDLTGVGKDRDRETAKKNGLIIVDYFKIIAEKFDKSKAPIVVGVYGSGDVCERLAGSAAAMYFWIPGKSTGWTRTRECYNKKPSAWHLFQSQLEMPLEVLVDTNILNPHMAGVIGAFNSTGLLGPLDDSFAKASLRFVKGSATLSRAPGTDPISTIQPSRMVNLLHDRAEWSEVEVTVTLSNVGTIQRGYVLSSILTAIDTMPR